MIVTYFLLVVYPSFMIVIRITSVILVASVLCYIIVLKEMIGLQYRRPRLGGGVASPWYLDYNASA